MLHGRALRLAAGEHAIQLHQDGMASRADNVRPNITEQVCLSLDRLGLRSVSSNTADPIRSDPVRSDPVL